MDVTNRSDKADTSFFVDNGEWNLLGVSYFSLFFPIILFFVTVVFEARKLSFFIPLFLALTNVDFCWGSNPTTWEAGA